MCNSVRDLGRYKVTYYYGLVCGSPVSAQLKADTVYVGAVVYELDCCG